MNHKVSLIIPCYNSSKYIEKTLKSVLDQDYNNCEIVIVDNESTDNTEKLISKVLKNYVGDKKIILSTAKNLYKNSSKEPVEKAYELISGKYFTIIDSDDFVKKNYVSNNMNFLNEKEENCKVWQSPIMGVNDSGALIGIKSHHNTYNSKQELKNKLLKYCCINSPTLFYHNSLLDGDTLIEHPQKYSGFCDYDKFCRIVNDGFYIYSSSKWLGHYYRWHEGQDSNQILSSGINYNSLIQQYWKNKWCIS